jgi:hypothetical protein
VQRRPENAVVKGVGTQRVGVLGSSTETIGVYARSETGTALFATTNSGTGVIAMSVSGQAIDAESSTETAVHALTKAGDKPTIVAYHNDASSEAAAVYARKTGDKGYAGYFEGDVRVTKNITVDGDITLSNADCAEDFDVVDPAADPGAVMVLGGCGSLEPCTAPYDRRVVGVVSGAGSFRPGVILDRAGHVPNRKPIALMGKVFCKVDASYGAVGAGDLLTTSPTSGHAMKAADPALAFGCVIGKALAPLPDGQGLLPVLVALQ